MMHFDLRLLQGLWQPQPESCPRSCRLGLQCLLPYMLSLSSLAAAHVVISTQLQTRPLIVNLAVQLSLIVYNTVQCAWSWHIYTSPARAWMTSLMRPTSFRLPPPLPPTRDPLLRTSVATWRMEPVEGSLKSWVTCT